MQSDERGSVIALASDSAAMTAINTYDEYGIPGASNAGAFQYAGQYWMSRPGVYYNTFRAYGQQLGRFMQTDPIGYGGGINLYVYTGDDPVNYTDPLGLEQIIYVTGHRCRGTWIEDDWGSSQCVELSGYGGSLRGPSYAWDPTLGFGGGGGRGGNGPAKTNVTESCRGIPALLDPKVQQAALNALKMSLSGNPSGTAEHAFWVSQSPIWKPWIGPTFTSGFQRQITGEMAQRTMPSVLGSILTLYYVRPLLIHAHPNNPPPSPVNQGDIGAAAQLGATIVAIDKAGNLTCTKH